MINQNTIVQKKPPSIPKPKEKTARDKAIEFAKNSVPKPKVKPGKKENSDVKGGNGGYMNNEDDDRGDHLFKGNHEIQMLD